MAPRRDALTPTLEVALCPTRTAIPQVPQALTVSLISIHTSKWTDTIGSEANARCWGYVKIRQIEESRYADVFKEVGGKHLAGDSEEVGILGRLRHVIHHPSHVSVFSVCRQHLRTCPPLVTSARQRGWIQIVSDFEINQLTQNGAPTSVWYVGCSSYRC